MDPDGRPSPFEIKLPPLSIGMRGQAHVRARARLSAMSTNTFCLRAGIPAGA